MTDPIDRQAAIDAFDCSIGGVPFESMIYVSEYADKMISRIKALPSAQPEQKIEELLPDGTLHLFTDADLSKVGRVLVSQNGTHYGALYYADGDSEFISWLLDEIWDDELWELNYRAFPELLCRRLVKAGWLKEEGGKYVRLDK